MNTNTFINVITIDMVYLQMEVSFVQLSIEIYTAGFVVFIRGSYHGLHCYVHIWANTFECAYLMETVLQMRLYKFTYSTVE